MNLKKFAVLFILSLFFIPLSFVFAKDLEIEEGKNLLFDFRKPEPYQNLWYDKTIVYDNVNIGAGTKVVLDSEWQYVLASYIRSETPIPENREISVIGSTETVTVQDEIYTTTYTYRNDENIATLSVANTGKITLNAGSELSIRNQYSLITSTQDVSLEYKIVKVDGEEKLFLKTGHLANADSLYPYIAQEDDHEEIFYNKLLKGDVDLFTGEIIFESGDSDTSLTFQEVSDKESKDYVLPNAGHDIIFGTTDLGGYKIDRAGLVDKSVGVPDNDTNIVEMTNNFQINSNRAAFNVVGFGSDKWSSSSRQVILGKLGGSTLSGKGMVVKKGEGTLTLNYLKTLEGFVYVDGMNLKGENTGYSWSIEEGMVLAHKQDNLGTASIYIDSKGTLGLGIYDPDLNSFSPVDVISRIEEGLQTNLYENKITSSNGEISIAGGTQIELSGAIDTVGDNNNLRLTFYKNSALVLSGKNNAENFIVSFGGEKGGEANYLITDVKGLADKSIMAINITEDELKEFAYFELVVDEAGNTEYSGSLQGEMYLHKLGTGTVTLSGENTYTQGTYISEGGLLLADTNSIGTGNIWFDRGVRGDSTTYSSIGVRASSETVSNIQMSNNIHVKNGAILNVAEKQNLTMLGDIVSYDARPGYETEFIKKGLGEATISGTLDANRQVNISTFNVQDGGFVLDKNIVLNSYFSLDGQGAYLKMNEDAGVKNNVIDIYSGDLTIFNDKNISSATAVNFYNVETSTDSFSKFHTMSTTTFSNDTIAGNINIAGNIEFVADATTTAKLNKFNFEAGDNIKIVKSGEGTFIADKDSGNFNATDLFINEGNFRLDNTNMEVSGTTFIDGGILSVSSTSHFASTASDKKITVLHGGIGIYDDNSIDSDTELRFEGTDEENLARLVVEAADVNLTNSIYVKTGVIIENERDLTFSGEHITGEYGILAKDGVGTMTIDSAGTFQMGELRTLGGNLLVKSNIEISTVTILGENALLSFENVNNANIKEHLFMGNGGTLSLLESKASIANLDLESANIVINSNSELDSNVINFYDSTINLAETSSIIKATTLNLTNGSYVKGYGKLDTTVRVKDGSSIYVGSEGNTGETLKAKNVVFESGSNLYIDVSDGNGDKTDLLDVSGDITVQKHVTLFVNFVESNSGADGAFSDISSVESKEYKFLTFAGNSSFDNTTNEIFDIVLSDLRYSASTAILGKSIFLRLAQEWYAYDIPGVTKNQKSMITVFNKIYADDIAKENMKSFLSTLDAIYSEYRSTGDRTQFLNALQDLSGIFYSNAFMTSAMLSKANIIYNRINDYSKEREEGNKVWAQVYTNNFSVAENEENPKFENGLYGMIAGYDTMVEDNVMFGIAGFYGQGELKQLEDKADVIDAGVNVYGNYKVNENVEVKGLFGYSLQDYDTTRNLRFIKQEMKSKFATNTISFDLEATYKYDLNEKLSLKPLVGANCAVVSNGDIEEDGDTEQRLKINKDSYTKAEVRVGVGLQSKSVSPFNWYVAAAVKQILAGDKFTTKSSFINAPEYEFEIESTKLASTSFVGNLGCAYDINSNFNVSLDLNADTGAASGFGANIGATYRW